ncbi:MAG TPA: hypothetical protein VGI84_08345 [Pseudonocardiaceae bacterium]
MRDEPGRLPGRRRPPPALSNPTKAQSYSSPRWRRSSASLRNYADQPGDQIRFRGESI